MKIYVDESHFWSEYASLNSVDGQYLLTESARRLTVPRVKKPLWILDIDSTLLCLSTRFQHIVFDYLRFEYGEAVPQAYWLAVQKLSPDQHRYGIREALEPVLGAEPARRLADRMFPFWYDAFFSERYLDKDFAYPGAADFVNALTAMGIHICYLTGRHAKTMTRGTRDSLRAHGFPLDDDQSFLVMKANVDESDVGYKQRYLSYLNQRYDVLGFIDNEPENIHAQMRVNPAVLPVWFHSISSDRVPVLSRIAEPHLCVLRSFASE